MRTNKQSEASRNNGKKSSGPVTNHGKANSARNAKTHNLVGDHFALLSNEDPELFGIHESEYIQRFQPVDGVEYDLVQKMIIASWRERRILAMEVALFEIEMARQAADVEEEWTEITAPARQVLALFGTTDAEKASGLLLRYASAARRAYDGALRNLRDLQGDRFHRKPNRIANRTAASSTTEEATEAEIQPAEQRQSEIEAVYIPRSRPTQPNIILRRKSDEHAKIIGKTIELRNEPETMSAASKTTREKTLRAFAA